MRDLAVPLLLLADFVDTGQMVSAEMFGSNAVFANMDHGRPTPAYEAAAHVLGVPNIRFGGGQADPNVSGGAQNIDGQNAINIVSMPYGALRPELVNFLEWCLSHRAAGNPIETTLVIPTKHLSVAEYAAFADNISFFAQTVMGRYAEVISGFQIGNEYWEMGETAYGQKASIAAEALARGMQWAGVPEWDQPEILVQMATAGNAGSEFGPGSASGSYGQRNTAANEQIIAQLSSEARQAIDGVTEHYYYTATGYAFPEGRSDLRFIDQDVAVWERAFAQELSLNITEWNVRTTNTQMQGLVGASTVVRQFENMIAIGADSAHVWTFDYHSRTALTLDTDYGVRLDGQGRLLNSAHGAVFDLMADALVGKELMNVSFAAGIPGIEVSAYRSANEAVIYVTSRSWDVVEVDFDASRVLDTFGAVNGVQISLDTNTTNGRQWVRGEAAPSINVNGEPYYYNEHDADVTLTDLYWQNASQVAFTLNPFEVIELTFALGGVPAPVAAPTPAPRNETSQPAAPAYAPPQSFGNWITLQDWHTQIEGGTGVDTLSVGLDRASVDVLFNGYGWAEIYGGPLSRAVTLDSVERLAFTDGVLALDTFGMAGQAYRLYQASFDRTPDQAGLRFWTDHLSVGQVSLEQAAQAFLTSAEFERAYSNNASLSDSRYLDLLYLNVLDRRPDAAGYEFWQGQQSSGMSRADMMVSFSESDENRTNVADQISDGIWFAN
ncbi:MAG: DUF4214 domain-containing protein [Pseudomonadota bacterium]